MLRKIEYTLSPYGITPHSPQFGGIQGENGATVLEFMPDEEAIAVLENLYASYDSIIYRVDCIDGAGQLLVGEATDTPETPFTFTLTDKHTCMGGRICVTLVISGVNNDDEDAVELYSFPATLYFKEFPVREDYSERHDLNQAVLQVKKMRDETYDIAAAALGTHETIVAAGDGALADIAAAREEAVSSIEAAAQEVNASIESAATFAESSGVSADTAAGYAGSALTSSVQASGYAEDALESSTSATASAKEAQQYAESAAASRDEVLSVTGDINAVLATVVNGA